MQFIHCGVNTFFPMVFIFTLIKFMFIRKLTTVVQSFYVDSLGVYLFTNTYLPSLPPSLPVFLLLTPFGLSYWEQVGDRLAC